MIRSFLTSLDSESSDEEGGGVDVDDPDPVGVERYRLIHSRGPASPLLRSAVRREPSPSLKRVSWGNIDKKPPSSSVTVVESNSSSRRRMTLSKFEFAPAEVDTLPHHSHTTSVLPTLSSLSLSGEGGRRGSGARFDLDEEDEEGYSSGEGTVVGTPVSSMMMMDKDKDEDRGGLEYAGLRRARRGSVGGSPRRNLNAGIRIKKRG